jgi:hypothetical protein
MTDVHDSLYDMDKKTAKLRADFAFKEFSQGGLLSLMKEPQRWAEIALDFAKAHPAK